MITTLPRWLRESLELHGIENDELWMDGEKLNVRCDSFEEAFSLRHAALQHTTCHISSFLSNQKPIVVLPEINQP